MLKTADTHRRISQNKFSTPMESYFIHFIMFYSFSYISLLIHDALVFKSYNKALHIPLEQLQFEFGAVKRISRLKDVLKTMFS